MYLRTLSTVLSCKDPMSRVGPHAFRIGSRNDGSFIVSCTTMSRWSVFQRSYPSERGRRRERDLYPLRRRGVPFSFAGAKVRRLFQTTKCFDNFFAKFFPQGDLCQLTRARTLIYLTGARREATLATSKTLTCCAVIY